MSDKIAGFAFKTARGIGKRPFAGWLFCIVERFLPLRRVARKNGVVAFHHPRPIEYPHVLIVPTRPIASLSADRLGVDRKSSVIWRMVELAKIATERFPANPAWKLVINGGTHQDVGQLHGHLLRANPAPDPSGFVLVDPTSNLAVWSQIDRLLHKADSIPGNGYSLIITWENGSKARAMITQSV